MGATIHATAGRRRPVLQAPTVYTDLTWMPTRLWVWTTIRDHRQQPCGCAPNRPLDAAARDRIRRLRPAITQLTP
ncbi:hypothetical protein GCM10022255_117450 [Dactylosporangium darangshiense]|uniref:Transposase n=1 Tax=Dactylosporangium darangshiense TaxID=579108 RepID=A0ABP8DWM6_9ACTN